MTTFTNDLYGRRTAKVTPSATTTYTWDPSGHLSSVTSTGTTVTYAYGITGMRESKTVETPSGATQTKSVWDGAALAAEQDSDGTVYRYLWGPDRTPLSVAVEYSTGATETFSYHTDALGSVVAMTDGSGSVVARYSYDPYGRCTVLTGEEIATRNPLRYRAYYSDAETGLFYLPARYYDPATYRFLSQDPAAPSAGDPLSLNAYAYCLGDPVDCTDPSGATVDVDGDGRLGVGDSSAENYIQTPDDSPYKEARRAGMQAATSTATDPSKTAADVATANRAAYDSQMMQGMSAADALRYCFGNFGDAAYADLSKVVVPGSMYYIDGNIAGIAAFGFVMIGDAPVPVGFGPTGGCIFNHKRYYDGHSEWDIRPYFGVAGGVAGLGVSVMRGKGRTDSGFYRELAGGLGIGGAAGTNLGTNAGYAQGGATLPGASLSYFIVY